MSRQQYYGTPEKGVELRTVKLGDLAPDHVRVAVKAVGINPIDNKILAWGAAIGVAVGLDFAGVVSDVGASIDNFRVGDEVAGVVCCLDRQHPDAGSFADTIDVPAVVLLKFAGLHDSKGPIDAGLVTTFAQAATTNVSLFTAAVAFAGCSSIPIKKDAVSGYALVYGGSGALAFAASQIARFVGFEVIVVASAKSEQLYSKLGFKHILDYHDSEWPQKAKEIGDITWAFETIGDNSILEKVKEAVSDSNPVTVVNARFIPIKEPQEGNITLKLANGFMWLTPKRQEGPWLIEADPAFFASRAEHVKALNEFVKQYVSLPVEVLEGLSAVPQALEKAKTASGQKTAVRLA